MDRIVMFGNLEALAKTQDTEVLNLVYNHIYLYSYLPAAFVIYTNIQCSTMLHTISGC